MISNQQHAIQNPAATTDAAGKRPYLKPAFTSESVFETMALACGKIAGQAQDACRRVASNS